MGGEGDLAAARCSTPHTQRQAKKKGEKRHERAKRGDRRQGGDRCGRGEETMGGEGLGGGEVQHPSHPAPGEKKGPVGSERTWSWIRRLRLFLSQSSHRVVCVVSVVSVVSSSFLRCPIELSELPVRGEVRSVVDAQRGHVTPDTQRMTRRGDRCDA